MLIGDAVINDGPGLMLIVEKFPWANTLEVTRGVEAALAELRPGLPNIEIDHQIFRPATFIELSVDNLTVALLIGAVLVVVVLGAFLFEWRVALISVVAIPLSLVAALLVLYLRGTTINTMVLAGFVVALGVDRRRRHHRRREHRAAFACSIACAAARSRLRRSFSRPRSRSAAPIVYATLIIVLAVVPVFFMGGLSGAFFEPLALSYALALLASMVVALTVTPALCLILLDKAASSASAPSCVAATAAIRRLFRALSQRRARLMPLTGVLLIAGIVVWPLLGQSLLPSFKERDFLMHWLTPPGTSHPEMYRVTVLASKELQVIPGVRNFGAHIGRACVADEPVGIDFTENWVSVDPKVDYDKTLAAIQETVDGYPGIYRDVQTYLRERIKEVLTGAGESIVVRIFGPELDGSAPSRRRR